MIVQAKATRYLRAFGEAIDPPTRTEPILAANLHTDPGTAVRLGQYSGMVPIDFVLLLDSDIDRLEHPSAREPRN